MNRPEEVEMLVDKYGIASIFTFATYSDISEEELFILTKGLFVALKVNSEVKLVNDFEKNMVIIESEESEDIARIFNRRENINLNIVLGGSFKKHENFIRYLLDEGLEYMKVDSEYIGFCEVESDV
tara:strand:+ start:1305 stop:1682 length:378 start_codon:yes stop_codon:yes gene_type:complete